MRIYLLSAIKQGEFVCGATANQLRSIILTNSELLGGAAHGVNAGEREWRRNANGFRTEIFAPKSSDDMIYIVRNIKANEREVCPKAKG